MDVLPFQRPGRFYRGNLHAHSTNSDGGKSPAEVVQAYQQAGYDFIAITDHFTQRYQFPITDTRPWRTPRFTTIIGAELCGGGWDIVAVGLPLDFVPSAVDETGPQLAARASATGAFVVAPHPYWYGQTPRDIMDLGPINAIETFNAVCQAMNDRGDSWHVLDALLAQGRRYLACTNDDAHFLPELPTWKHAWVRVKAEHVDPQALLDALHAGDFYCSTGPDIRDVRFERGDRITVECSPCQSIFIAGQGKWSRWQHGHNLSEASWSLEGLTSPYLRVTVQDAAGLRAWSNPIWL